jgi:exopolyphosphatase/guanosine-5'-triphosphate,3'-diphosphate pyrophosphatase
MPDGNTTGAGARSGAPLKRPPHARGPNGSGRTGSGRKGPGPGGPVFGAVDLGTNNCRLLVATPDGAGFRVIGSFSRIVRLGEGLHADGTLAPSAMDRTIDALRICAQIMRRHRVGRARCIATEACRRAANGPEFLDRIALETGLMFEAVTSDEEARLTLAGCSELLDRHCDRAVVFDIGGGSTEVMWLRVDDAGAEPLGILSMPFGVVTLAERLAAGADGAHPDPVDASTFEALVADIDSHLDTFDAAHGISRKVADGAVSLLGTSGTITTMGGLYLDLDRYDRARVDGLLMETDSLMRISADLARMTTAERMAIGCIGADRADLMVMGCAILQAILRRWPVPRVRAADRGIREGLLSAMVADHVAGRGI